MSFKIIFSDEALFQLKKTDITTSKRIIAKINESCINPFHFFKRLVGRDEYKLRIGNYRVIARILQKEESIFILSFGLRENIYKK